ncbi:MAG: class I SAM-dependent methyltransferase [Methylovirgula sp.]
MNEDFEGYSNEIDYTFGYYPWLSPAHLRLICLTQSISFPSHRPLRYLELGYGNGVSLNIHAAACPGEYWGADISTSHAAFSKGLAEAAGAGVRALNLSFSDLLNYQELPDFDVIATHGVWSYISDANRNTIIRLLRERLVDGGLFCVSYNTMPGSSGIVPLQHLLRLYSENGGQHGTASDRLGAGISFVSELRRAGSKFFASIPKASNRLEQIRSEDPVYLVHEYLHEFWHVTSFAQISRTLAEVGLHFLASGNLMDQYEDLSVDEEGLALLASLGDPVMRETARDFLRDQQFRQDIFVKGNLRELRSEGSDTIQELSVILAIPRVEVPTKINTPDGSIGLTTPLFARVLTALAADRYRAKTVRELIEQCCEPQLTTADVIRAVMILISADIVHQVQEKVVIEDAAPACQKLNKEILQHTSLVSRVPALASPLTGSGIRMSRSQQLCLMAYRAGAKSADEWARFAWNRISEKGRHHETDADLGGLGARVLREALLFQLALPIYCALGLADPNIG